MSCKFPPGRSIYGVNASTRQFLFQISASHEHNPSRVSYASFVTQVHQSELTYHDRKLAIKTYVTVILGYVTHNGV